MSDTLVVLLPVLLSATATVHVLRHPDCRKTLRDTLVLQGSWCIYLFLALLRD